MRLGRHGGLVFVCEDGSQRLLAIKDELHRKESVSFQESNGVEAGSTVWIDEAGPSWGAALLRDGTVRGFYHHLADRLRATGPGFGFAAGGFEHIVSNLDQTPGRALHYHELDRPASALLILKFNLAAPLTYSLRCGPLRRHEDGWRLTGNIDLWISGAVPRVDADSIAFAIPAGSHEITMVVWSQPSSALLYPVAFALSRQESWIAAMASSWIADRVPLLLPTDTLEDADKTRRLIREIGPTHILVGAAVDDRIAAVAAEGHEITRLPADQTVGEVIARAIGIEPPRAGIGIGPDCSDPAPLLRRARIARQPLVPAEKTEHSANARFDEPAAPLPAGLVVCDSADPFVRILAAAYAGAKGSMLLLIADAAAPPDAPQWEAHSEDVWPELIRQYLARLTEDVNRIVPDSVRAENFSSVVVFTSGRAYSLVQTPRGSWATSTSVGVLPDGDVPWLVPRCLFHSHAAQPSPTFTIVCDALADRQVKTESRSFLEHLSSTASQAVPLRGPDATGRALEHLLAIAPVDLVSLTCHGHRDSIVLADGRLRAQEIQRWSIFARPIVLNNSCASWPTTGPAFVTAGARAYVGTLWPVRHGPATRVARLVHQAILASPTATLGDALRDALKRSAESSESDALAYVLVGLPDVPARIQALSDVTDRQDVLELALISMHSLTIALVQRGQREIARRLRDALTGDLVTRLEETVRDVGHLRYFNRQGEYLPSIVAILETDFWTRVLEHDGPDAVPGGIEGLIARHEAAIGHWEGGDGSLDAQLNRVNIISRILVSAVMFLVRAGRWQTAWEYACRAGAARLRPAEPIPTATGPEIGVKEVIETGRVLPNGDEFLNAVGLALFQLSRLGEAEAAYDAALTAASAAADEAQRGRILSNLAQVAEARGHLDEAEAGYARALPILEEAQDRYCAFLTRLHQGQVLLRRGARGDVDRALAISVELEERVRALSPPVHVSQCHCDALGFRAAALASAGDVEQAMTVALSSLEPSRLPGPRPTRMYSAFAALTLEALHADPAESSERCFAVFERARDVRDFDVMWNAVLMLLTLERNTFARDHDKNRLRACLELVDQALSETEWISSSFVADAKRRAAAYLLRETVEFMAFLSEEDNREFYEVLSRIEPSNERWPAALRFIEDCAEFDGELLCSWRSLWRRSATVTIAPPDRTHTLIVDTPPPEARRPLFLRYPITVPRDASVLVEQAAVEHAHDWQQIGRTLYYRCSEPATTLVVDKRGLIEMQRDGLIRYSEWWGSKTFLYDVTIVLPVDCIPLALAVKPVRRSLYPPSAFVMHRDGRWSVELRCHPDLLARLEQSSEIPLARRGWMAKVVLEFSPAAAGVSRALSQASPQFPMPFRAFLSVIERSLG